MESTELAVQHWPNLVFSGLRCTVLQTDGGKLLKNIVHSTTAALTSRLGLRRDFAIGFRGFRGVPGFFLYYGRWKLKAERVIVEINDHEFMRGFDG